MSYAPQTDYKIAHRVIRHIQWASRHFTGSSTLVGIREATIQDAEMTMYDTTPEAQDAAFKSIKMGNTKTFHGWTNLKLYKKFLLKKAANARDNGDNQAFRKIRRQAWNLPY